MSNRYAPLPNPRNNINSHQELDAAFGDSDDEDDINNTSESHPLNPARSSVEAPSPPTIHTPPAHTRIPGSYDFENVDYDYPPPGSPPGPSAVALPNDHGNSNGLVPSFSLDSISGPRRGWFNRTATAILPTYYVQRFGLGPARPTGPIGGGINNDGVFANVTAKPTAPRRIQDGQLTSIIDPIFRLSITHQATRLISFLKTLELKPLHHTHPHRLMLYLLTGRQLSTLHSLLTLSAK